MSDNTSVATLIRRWRERALLTQEQLAELAGLNVRTIRRLEAGGLGRPRGASVRLLADALALTEHERAQLLGAIDGTTQPIRQLPTDIPGFVARADQLRRMTASLTQAAPGVVRIVAISGMAGVGKTTLAVHWAHHVAADFPDGHLFVDLHGYDAGGLAVDPAQALTGFLDALDPGRSTIPSTLDARASLYRSLIADRQMLIVLDNARDAAQVRPLLPGSPQSLVLVTSRRRLTELVATHNPHTLTLEPLPAPDAVELMAVRLGRDRTAAEPEAVQAIIDGCARLPLALAVVAAQAGQQPECTLAVIAEQLRSAEGLNAFASDDPRCDTRAAFSWSYQRLSLAAARLFRLLSLHPGNDIGVAAAASLTGLPVRQTVPLLTELTSAHLLGEDGSGRYTLHDLLRAYAIELTGTHDSEQDRHQAMHRVMDFYLHTVFAAERLLAGYRDPVVLDAPLPGVAAVELADRGQAVAWYQREHRVLAAVTAQAVGRFDRHACDLAWLIFPFLYRQGFWSEQVALQKLGLEAAIRLGDLASLIRAHRVMGNAMTRMGDYEQAQHHLDSALDACHRLGDVKAESNVYNDLTWMRECAGAPAEALRHAREALRLSRSIGDTTSEGFALNNLGWNNALLGNYHEAIEYCAQALPLLRQTGSTRSEAATLDSLGYAYHHLGEYTTAIGYFQRSIEIFERAAERSGTANTLTRLGEAYLALGDTGRAADAWEKALAIFEDIAPGDADRLRAQLDKLVPPAT